MKNIFAVIVNWNRPIDTVECVESLLGCNLAGVKLKILIVDNASSDSSLMEFKKLVRKKHNVFVLANKVNLGYAGGNNTGIKYAIGSNADYILLLNNDVTLDKKIIDAFMKNIVSEHKVGILTPKIYFKKGYEFYKDRYKKNEKGRVIWYAGGVIDWNNMYASNRGVDQVDENKYLHKEEVDFATGTCMFISTHALKEIGIFDERYFMYFEDVDLSFRMKKSGWKVIYIPSALLWHKVAQSSGIGSELNDYFLTRNRLLFGLKYAPIITKIALVRESIKLLRAGRLWQKRAVKDFYLRKFERGSWPQ